MSEQVIDFSQVTQIEFDGANIDIIRLTPLSDEMAVEQTTVVVTVASWLTQSVFVLDGIRRAALNVVLGHRYVFDQSDPSNSGHQIVFKTSAGAAYATGVESFGTPGTEGAYTTFDVPMDAPSGLIYSCSSHGDGMGSNLYRFNRAVVTAGYELWRRVYVNQSAIQNVQVYIPPTYGQEQYVTASTAGGSGSWYVNCSPKPAYTWTGSCGDNNPASCSCPSGYTGSCNWTNVGGCPWYCSVKCEKFGTRTVQTGGGYYETQSQTVDTSYWEYFF